MATHLPVNGLLTLEQYLDFESGSPIRHEFVAGTAHAMSGATKRHNGIILNLATRLLPAARSSGCRVYTETVKLRVAFNVIYYPDVVVACGPEGGDPLIEDDPCLVVEVLSPSTRITDRREKLMLYRQLDRLGAYLIVHQERRRVERHWRDQSGTWQQADLVDRGTFPVPCPDLQLSLAEIYEGVETDR